MSMEFALRGLQYANFAGTLLLVWRLVDQRLQRAYRWFFVYLVYDLIETLVGLNLPRGRAGVYTYMAAQGIKVSLATLVVFEIYRLALAERKALARFSRNIVACAFLASLLLSLTVLLSSQKGPTIQFAPLRYTYVMEGFMDSTQLLLLCLMTAFLAWFPVDLRKNLALYIFGFVVYFSAHWIILFLFVRRIAQSDWFNVLSFAVTLICIGFWIRAMDKAGERETTTTGRHWNPEEMHRLKAQLDEINASLERSAR